MSGIVILSSINDICVSILSSINDKVVSLP